MCKVAKNFLPSYLNVMFIATKWSCILVYGTFKDPQIPLIALKMLLHSVVNTYNNTLATGMI